MELTTGVSETKRLMAEYIPKIDTQPILKLPQYEFDKMRPTLLVVDDEIEMLWFIGEIFSADFNVVTLQDPERLDQVMNEVYPNVIICDVMMPVMDGMECCRRLKSEVQTSHIPVMMLTAYAVDEQKIKGYECGADSYISKPFSARLLTVRLRNLIENRRRLQSLFADISNVSLQKTPVAEVDKGFLEKLHRLIEERLSDPDLSVEELGEQIGLSRVQLYRKTKALCGYSPNELLRIARLKKAASLLASTEKTISEITYEVGFSSPSYFTKCYKEYFGENPTAVLKRKK